jgi:hypothetical protein
VGPHPHAYSRLIGDSVPIRPLTAIDLEAARTELLADIAVQIADREELIVRLTADGNHARAAEIQDDLNRIRRH